MNILIMILLISILIIVHEIGHFVAAKLMKIQVDRFGLGLPVGPAIWEKKLGETVYCIHPLLLGGYVSFPDENPESKLPKNSFKRFENKPLYQRAIVISAGVFMNIVLAFILVFFTAGFTSELPSGKYSLSVEGLQKGKDLSAENIGIQKGDKIVSVNGVIIDHPTKFITIVQNSKKFNDVVSKEKAVFQFNEIKRLNRLIINPPGPIKKGTKILLPKPNPESQVEVKGSLVEVSGYKPEGLYLDEKEKTLRNSLENKNFFIADGKTRLEDLATATADTYSPIYITVERNGKIIALKEATANKEGLIGIKFSYKELPLKVNGIGETIKYSYEFLKQNTIFMFEGLFKLFTGGVPLSDMHGIIAVTKIGSDMITQNGIWDGVLLTALISINLAIINLLPIPALDGGHLFFLLIEKIKGSPVSPEIQENFSKVGFAILIGLMIFVLFNDIFALITNKF